MFQNYGQGLKHSSVNFNPDQANQKTEIEDRANLALSSYFNKLLNDYFLQSNLPVYNGPNLASGFPEYLPVVCLNCYLNLSIILFFQNGTRLQNWTQDLKEMYHIFNIIPDPPSHLTPHLCDRFQQSNTTSSKAALYSNFEAAALGFMALVHVSFLFQSISSLSLFFKG